MRNRFKIKKKNLRNSFIFTYVKVLKNSLEGLKTVEGTVLLGCLILVERYIKLIEKLFTGAVLCIYIYCRAQFAIALFFPDSSRYYS